jgi:thymidine kinase
MDFRGIPFPLIPEIMAIADEVKKLKAVCFDCGSDAGMSYKIEKTNEIIDVGASEKYKSLCFNCWTRSG